MSQQGVLFVDTVQRRGQSQKCKALLLEVCGRPHARLIICPRADARAPLCKIAEMFPPVSQSLWLTDGVTGCTYPTPQLSLLLVCFQVCTVAAAVDTKVWFVHRSSFHGARFFLSTTRTMRAEGLLVGTGWDWQTQKNKNKNSTHSLWDYFFFLFFYCDVYKKGIVDGQAD